MQPFHILLALYAVLALLAFAFLFRWEYRYFSAKAMGGAWLVVRLATVPIALATAAIVLIPARATSGMEGLAVFYVLAFTAAPLFWFLAHWIAGRLTRPPMRASDSVLIAASPIVLCLVLSAVAHTLQPLAWSVLRQFK